MSPITLFVYNRPWHTEQTLRALQANELASESILYVYADGAKADASQEVREQIKAVRQLITKEQWCKEVHLIERNKNWGLADNIVDGVTKVVNKHAKIIVLEDDIVISKGFLRYMNDALEVYQDEDKVMHVGAYLPHVKRKKVQSETFLSRFMNCWGWGTWKESWDKLNWDVDTLYKEVTKSSEQLYEFNLEGVLDYENQLKANITGQLNTWAIRWFTSIFLQNGLCLYPNKSLVQNIGMDNSGVHCSEGMSETFKTNLYHGKIKVHNLRTLKESTSGKDYLKAFYRVNPPKVPLKTRIKKILKSLYA